jgi:pre-mRNA-processing factor 17
VLTHSKKKIGFVEDQAMSDLDFRTQQRTYQVKGYAQNPSILGDTATALPYVGDVHAAYSNGGALLSDLKPTRAQQRELKRKRKTKGALGVFDEEGEEEDQGRPREYKGPWAGWDEEKVGEPVGPELEEYEVAAKRSTKPVVERSEKEIGFGEEKSILHGQLSSSLSLWHLQFLTEFIFAAKSLYDYLGRSYISIPRDVDVDLEPEEPGLQQCYIPKKCIHTWSGHTKGVSAIRLFPGSGHLLLSGSMDTKVKVSTEYYSSHHPR